MSEPNSDREQTPLSGKTILITGATRGIGYATAEALANLGANLIVHGRDARRTECVRDALEVRSRGGSVRCEIADLSSLDAVRSLAERIAERSARLDVLINNAGLVTRRRETTVDGLERQLAVNHLAPFLLTHLLLDKLKSAAPSRIVNVASNAHRRAAFDIDDLNWERRPYSGIGAYGATKLANILFTTELARRLTGSGVTVNCLHPGVVATNIFTGMGILGSLFGILSRPLLLPSRKGAETSVYLAAADESRDVSGAFFDRCRPVEPAAAARDESTARRLWDKSAALVDLPGDAY